MGNSYHSKPSLNVTFANVLFIAPRQLCAPLMAVYATYFVSHASAVESTNDHNSPKVRSTPVNRWQVLVVLIRFEVITRGAML